MPMKYPVLLGVCFMLIYSHALFAGGPTDPAAIANAYNTCLQEERSAIIAKMNAVCAMVDTKQDLQDCVSKINPDPDLTSAQMNFCKMKSNLLVSSQAETVEESKLIEDAQKKHEEQILNPSNVKEAIASKFRKFTDAPAHTSSVPLPPARPPDADKAPANTAARNAHSDTPSKTTPENGPGNTAPAATGIMDDANAAQAQVSGDISSCTNSQSQASLCCNNPLACASAADQASVRRLNGFAQNGDQQGLTDYCRQMQGLGDTSGSINTRLGALCTSNQSTCTSTCSSLEQKYRGLMAQCQNCASSSVFENAISQLSSGRMACSQLQVRGDLMVRQGLSSAGNSGSGNICQQLAMLPQSLMNANQPMQPASATPPGDLYGCASNPTSAACVACTQNPNAPACAAAKVNTARGSASFQPATSAAVKQAEKSGFFLGDNADSSKTREIGAANAAQPAAVKPIPNGGGGGGGMPGGSHEAPVRPGGGLSGNSAMAQARSYSTDIDQGLRSGGGYSQPAGGSVGGDFGYDGGRVPAGQSQDGSKGLLGLDLRKYLPGGLYDPNRRVAGKALQTAGINGKEEDIWQRISNKFEEKCRLGLLWRCR
jgi:hypothetical protein